MSEAPTVKDSLTIQALPELPVVAWRVTAKPRAHGMTFTRGIYEREWAQEELDGDTQEPLTSHAAALSAITQLQARLDVAIELGATYAARLEAALDMKQQLLALIVEHNEGCRQSCEASREHKRCDGYISRGRMCPDCPRDWEIEGAAIRSGGE